MIIEFFPQSNDRSGSERRRRLQFDQARSLTDDYLRFGRDYFDNPEFPVGYGQYTYDGRYQQAAEKMCSYYGLGRGSRVLEVGCAKGFLLVEFQKLGMVVTGIDVSDYAVDNAHPAVRHALHTGDISNLPFPDAAFDLVLGKEVLPHIAEENLPRAIRECMRVASGPLFFEIQCGRNREELHSMKEWDQTHKSLYTPEQWDALLGEIGYCGDVHYKILMPDENILRS